MNYIYGIKKHIGHPLPIEIDPVSRSGVLCIPKNTSTSDNMPFSINIAAPLPISSAV